MKENVKFIFQVHAQSVTSALWRQKKIHVVKQV